MQESNPMEHFNLKGSADAIQIWIMAKWEQVGKEVFNFCRTRSVVLSRFGNDGGVGMFWRRWAWNSTSTWIDVSPHAGKPGVPVQHFSHRVSCKFQQGLLQSCRGGFAEGGYPGNIPFAEGGYPQTEGVAVLRWTWTSAWLDFPWQPCSTDRLPGHWGRTIWWSLLLKVTPVHSPSIWLGTRHHQ